MNKDIEEVLKELIVNASEKNIKKDQIKMNSSLINDLGFDSINLMKLIVDIEQQFEIEYGDGLQMISNIANYDTLVHYISDLLEQKNG